MKLKDVFHRHEGIVLRASEQKRELICGFIPGDKWFLFKTNHRRYFTCKLSENNTSNRKGTPWKEVEFDQIEEGVHYPFD